MQFNYRVLQCSSNDNMAIERNYLSIVRGNKMFVGAGIEFIKTDWVFLLNVFLRATQHIRLILVHIN